MKSIQRNQGGFSLVEILLVLGIIAILAIAAFIIFPQVQASNRANAEQSNITTITAGIKNLYGATRNYTGVGNPVVNQARIFPASMNGGSFASDAPITSSWSGAVTVAPGTGAPPRQFTITYADMPSEVCTRLVPGMLQNFVSIAVGDGATPAALDDDATPGDIVAACNAADAVTVVFTSN